VDGVGEVEGLAGAGLAGCGVDSEVAVAGEELVGVAARQRRHRWQRPSAGVVEALSPVEVPAALVYEPVVAAAEQHQVSERGGATARPVVEVVGIEEAAVLAAGEAAAAIAPP
jgi:hypothetical protein